MVSLIPFQQDVWARAAKRAADMPIYGGSHRGTAANEVGALGEVVFEEFLRSHEIPFTPRYVTTDDLLLFRNTIDVKTKDRTVEPRLDYECSVPMYNHKHQRPNWYVFVSLLRNRNLDQGSIARFTHAYIVGWATLAEVDRGQFWNAGDTDPSNGTKFWTACRNLKIRDLRPMDALVAECQRHMS